MFGLNDRVAAIQSAAAGASAQIASQSAQLEQMELVHARDAGALHEAELRNDGLAGDLSALAMQRAAETERASARNAELEAALTELSERKSSLEVQLGAAKKHEAALESRLASASARNAEVEGALTELTERKANLEVQLDATKKHEAALDSRLASASARAVQLGRDLRESADRQAALEDSLRAAKARENALDGQLRDLSAQRDDLESRLNALNAHSKSIANTLRESLAFQRKTLGPAVSRSDALVIFPHEEAAREGIRFACERPKTREPLTGAIEIIGWCFGTSSQVVGVEISWNEARHSAEYGSMRSDVGRVYPQYAAALTSEFRCTVNAKPGDYFVVIVALCSDGQRRRLGEGVVSVQPKPLMRALDAPDLGALRAEAVRFSGWCFSRDQRISSLTLYVGDRRFPCGYGLQRDDVAMSFRDVAHAGPSGFECDLMLVRGCFDIRIEAILESGERVTEMVASAVRVRRFWGFQHALQRALERTRRVHNTVRRAARWMRRQRRLPRWHELPLLLRKARTHLQTSTNEGELRPPAGWQLPPVADPYEVWLELNAMTPRSIHALRERLNAAGSKIPRISVVMPVFDPDVVLLERAIKSVRDQVLTEWELCVADDRSSNENVRRLLQAAAGDDARIRVIFRDVNGNISAATNSAAALASGTFLLFLDQDDELSSDALGEIALHLALHPDTDLLYSDDDKIDRAGDRFAPQFKPDWSPELLLSYMYMGHALVVRRELFEQLEGLREGLEGSQDHDFALRASEVARRVGHLPLVLYHWRATTSSTATNADAKPSGFSTGERAVQEALVRRHSKGRAVRPKWAQRDRLSLYSHEFGDEGPHVTIIIPTRNNHAVLRRCLDSLAATTYRNFEIMVVNDNSDEAETLAYLKKIPHRVLTLANPSGRFNFAAITNRAAAAASGEFLLFLNDDTEVLEPRWLSSMVGYAQLAGVGAVGAHLVYPDGRTQHAGIIHGLYDGLAGPAFKLMPQTDHGYLYYAMVARNYSAVTAACLLTPRVLFSAVGGFDEKTYPVAYNDVDYCYRVVDAGYRCVYSPDATLLHHEGYSRGFDDRPQEVAAFRIKYHERNDPYYSPHLSLDDERFSISARRLPSPARSRPPARALMCAFTLSLEGAPHSQFELTLALKQAGVIDPIVYAPAEGPLRAEYERNGIPVHVFEHPLRGAATLAQYEQAIAKFSRWIEAQGAEVLYANTMESFYAIAAARHASVPSIWNIRESEPWQTYYRHLGPEIAGRALDCFAYPYRVIFVAHATRERYAALASRHQFTVIHNGLNLERLSAAARLWPRAQARARLGLAEDETMLLLLGTVCERKGQLDLVEALPLLDAGQTAKCRCFIVGDRPGSYSARVKQRVRELAQQRGLRITIVPETHDTALYYGATDIFICTSRVESYPRVILEAMAYGLPIVTTPVFGVREQVTPGVNGLFYEPGDLAGLRDALDRLLTDGALRAELAANAKPVLATLTSFEEMVAGYGSIFVEAAECQITQPPVEILPTGADTPRAPERTVSDNAGRASATANLDSLQNTGE